MFGALTRTPEGIVDACEAVDGERLQSEQADGDHEQDELGNMAQDAERDDQGGCACWRVRRLCQDHQARSEAQRESSGNDAGPGDAAGESRPSGEQPGYPEAKIAGKHTNGMPNDGIAR